MVPPFKVPSADETILEEYTYGVGDRLATYTRIEGETSISIAWTYNSRGLLTQRTTSVHSTASFAVPGATPLPAAGDGAGAVVVAVNMSAQLLLGVMEKRGAAGTAASSPPLVMLVDTRGSGPIREVWVQLGPRVVGWTPFVGDCAAGFAGCAKRVLGSNATVVLAPGQGVLLALTVAKDPAGGGTGSAAGDDAAGRLWSSSRRRSAARRSA